MSIYIIFITLCRKSKEVYMCDEFRSATKSKGGSPQNCPSYDTNCKLRGFPKPHLDLILCWKDSLKTVILKVYQRETVQIKVSQGKRHIRQSRGEGPRLGAFIVLSSWSQDALLFWHLYVRIHTEYGQPRKLTQASVFRNLLGLHYICKID